MAYSHDFANKLCKDLLWYLIQINSGFILFFNEGRRGNQLGFPIAVARRSAECSNSVLAILEVAMDSFTHRCFLVLNGHSTRQGADRFCGFTDPPLSARGRGAVLGLRQTLVEQEVRLPRVWYVSDRRRAVETFEIMTAGMHAPILHITEKLREINFGNFENLTWEELPADFQRHYESCLRTPMELKFPGGESFREMCERVSASALEILSYQDDDSSIAIVGHQGSLRVWFLMEAGLPPSAFFDETPELADARWVDIGPQQVLAWRRKYLFEHFEPDSPIARRA